MKKLSCCLILLATLPTGRLLAEQRHLHQAIGDPARRDQQVDIVLDGITDTRTGNLVTATEMAVQLRDARLLLVGESHTDIDFHRAQLRVLQALVADGREVLIGLEMYPYTEQSHLDDWSRGLVTEEGFVELSRWYEMWGYHWNYYRDIFRFARDNNLGMYAVNAPRDVIKSVRKNGFQGLTEEEAAHIPTDIEPESDEHRQLFMSFFDEDDALHSSMTPEMWTGMINAQSTWDATMGHNAVRNLEEHGGDDAIMVVLVGSGHVSYGLGIARQSAKWLDGRIASVIPISVVDDDGDQVERVQASYADYLWGLPAARDPIYPVLGLSTRKIESEEGTPELYRVIMVSEDSVAESAGFQIEDVMLEMNGVSLIGKETFNRLMAELRWGDTAAFKIDRNGQMMELKVAFRRTLRDETNEEEVH